MSFYLFPFAAYLVNNCVTKTFCLGKTRTICDRYRLSVTDTDSLSQAGNVCDRHRLYMARALNFITDILNITKSVSIWKLGKYYFKTMLSDWMQGVFVTNYIITNLCTFTDNFKTTNTIPTTTKKFSARHPLLPPCKDITWQLKKWYNGIFNLTYKQLK